MSNIDSIRINFFVKIIQYGSAEQIYYSLIKRIRALIAVRIQFINSLDSRLRGNDSKFMNKNLEKAVRIVKKGGIIIFPTDTAFGIGCRIDNEHAVRRLFDLRKRPRDKAVPVLVSSIEMAQEYIEKIEPDVADLMKKYWPGGLTIVLKCKKEKVPTLVRGGGDTVGFRIPNNQIVIELIEKVGVPILGPSANFSGGKTPFEVSDLEGDLVRMVDFVLPGRCSSKRVSTVIDCSVAPFKIIREGAVKI